VLIISCYSEHTIKAGLRTKWEKAEVRSVLKIFNVSILDGVIVRAGSGILLERIASSPAVRVGYSPDREGHATITLNSCTLVITIT